MRNFKMTSNLWAVCSILFDFVFIYKCHITYITCLLRQLLEYLPLGERKALVHYVTLYLRQPLGWYSCMSPSKPCDICMSYHIHKWRFLLSMCTVTTMYIYEWLCLIQSVEPLLRLSMSDLKLILHSIEC